MCATFKSHGSCIRSSEMDFDHEYKTQVKAHHIDSYGHVNNAAYLQLLEEARWDWIRLGGATRELVQELGVGPIVVDIEIRFSRELKEGEEITIKSKRDGEVMKMYSLKQIIYKANGEIASKAKFRMAFLNIRDRKMVDPPQAWVDVLMTSCGAGK